MFRRMHLFQMRSTAIYCDCLPNTWNLALWPRHGWRPEIGEGKIKKQSGQNSKVNRYFSAFSLELFGLWAQLKGISIYGPYGSTQAVGSHPSGLATRSCRKWKGNWWFFCLASEENLLQLFFQSLGLGSWLFVSHNFCMYTIHNFTHPDLHAVLEMKLRCGSRLDSRFHSHFSEVSRQGPWDSRIGVICLVICDAVQCASKLAW